MITLFSLVRVFGEIRFPWECIYAWSAVLGKILTTDDLEKQRIMVADWCCMCKKNGEPVDHILLHCEVTSVLWSMFSLFGLAWVMPRQVVDLFDYWRGQFGCSYSTTMWEIIRSCIMWCIWRERNKCNFEDRERTMVDLKAFFFSTRYHLAVAYDYFFLFLFLSFFFFFFFFFFFSLFGYK
jgi:hypothetical protein